MLQRNYQHKKCVYNIICVYLSMCVQHYFVQALYDDVVQKLNDSQDTLKTLEQVEGLIHG